MSNLHVSQTSELENNITNDRSSTYVDIRKDLVPILPGRFLGFHHPSNEIHIQSSDGSFVSCPGQDNTDGRCIVGDAKNILEAKVSDHDGTPSLNDFTTLAKYAVDFLGPYDGVTMGC